MISNCQMVICSNMTVMAEEQIYINSKKCRIAVARFSHHVNEYINILFDNQIMANKSKAFLSLKC